MRHAYHYLENSIWRRTSLEMLQDQPGILLPASLPVTHTDRYSVGKPSGPRDRSALRIARPGPPAQRTPQRPARYNRCWEEAIRPANASYPIGRVGGGVWAPPRRPTTQGDTQAEGARREDSQKKESIRIRPRQRSAAMRDFGWAPFPAAIGSQARRRAFPALRQRGFA